MVAILSPGKSIRNAFYYNEHKVKEGVARLIHAENYPLDQAHLTEGTRLNMLLKMAGQNSRTEVNSLHVTLNFDPSERLSEEKLKEITRSYMDKIGFGNQPYLVYQHFDAGHQHVHIVTTNIEATGAAINLHHLGIKKSEPARKELENTYNLVRAEDKQKASKELKPAYAAKVVYGRTDSRRAIANVLTALLDSYKFTSLPELNALLGQYNVMADKGSEQSRVFKNNGLMYRILDGDGKPIGVPIKASSFYNKATLKELHQKFIQNGSLKLKYRNQAKNTIDTVLDGKKFSSLSELKDALNLKGIHAVIRVNKDGLAYGITYVDHNTKCVFNGSELGKSYSIKGILDGLKPSETLAHHVQEKLGYQMDKINGLPKTQSDLDNTQGTAGGAASSKWLEELMENEGTKELTPFELKAKRKKRKKRQSI